MIRTRQYGVLGVIALLASACGGGGEPERPVPTSISISPAGPISITAGTSQTLTATVLDQNGQPMAGQTISWTSSSGSVIVTPTGQTTTVSGTVAGTGTVTATIGTVSSTPVTVSIVGAAAVALVKVNDLPGTTAAGTGDIIRVRVVDGFGNPVAGVVVTFEVTGGGGSVDLTLATSDAQGIAAVRWTTGTTVGANTATATAAVGGPIGFSVSTVAGPPASVRATSPQVVVIDVGTSFVPTWQVRDAHGNVVPAAGLTFSSRGSAASVTTGGQVTGNAPGQALVVAQSVVVPSAGDSILVIVGVPNNPVVRTDLASLSVAAGSTFTVAIIVDMRSATTRLGSATLRIDWAPGLLTYVSDADGAAGVGATVNATQAAAGQLRMSLASPNNSGWAGAVEVRRITFQAASALNVSGVLAITTTEIADTAFTNLAPNTVSVSHPLKTR